MQHWAEMSLKRDCLQIMNKKISNSELSKG